MAMMVRGMKVQTIQSDESNNAQAGMKAHGAGWSDKRKGNTVPVRNREQRQQRDELNAVKRKQKKLIEWLERAGPESEISPNLHHWCFPLET